MLGGLFIFHVRLNFVIRVNVRLRFGQAGANGGPVLLHADPVSKSEFVGASPRICQPFFVVALLKKPGHVIQWHAKAGLPGSLSIVVVRHVVVVLEPDKEVVMVRKIWQ